jgi:hypothetical protein
MTHSLLLVGQPVDLPVLQYQLNAMLDSTYSTNCIREIIAIIPGVYLVVFDSVTLLLSSLYYNLKIDDARIVLPCGCYTTCFAEKELRMYKEPWPWKTNGPYTPNIILYKRNALLTYTCEWYE